jgi:Tat protein secretion system quality control protein TatD with DNase activity
VANERNEPAKAVYSVRAISEIKGIPPDEAAEAAYDNTGRLLGDLF